MSKIHDFDDFLRGRPERILWPLGSPIAGWDDVNIHSCVNTPGKFCGPWIVDDGFLSTHTPEQTGYAGLDGTALFKFYLRLFWAGDYTIIAHIKFGAMHFAIGTQASVVLVLGKKKLLERGLRESMQVRMLIILF